jgi:hypothetical protein
MSNDFTMKINHRVDMTTLLGLVLERGGRLASAADIDFFEDGLRQPRLITAAVASRLVEVLAP